MESPLRLSQELVSSAHYLYSRGSKDLLSKTQGHIMLMDHILGRHSVWSAWLPATLREAHARYAAQDIAIEDQFPVPPDFFAPGFAWSEEAVKASQAHLLASLDPARNPYLRSAADMQALGFVGESYRLAP